MDVVFNVSTYLIIGSVTFLGTRMIETIAIIVERRHICTWSTSRRALGQRL